MTTTASNCPSATRTMMMDRPVSSGRDVVEYLRVVLHERRRPTRRSAEPVSSAEPPVAVRDVRQPRYPFPRRLQLDLARRARRTEALFGYMSWTDNRDVVEGDDRARRRQRADTTTTSTSCSAGSTLGLPADGRCPRGRTTRPGRRPVHRGQLRQCRRCRPEHLRDFDHVPVAVTRYQFPSVWAGPVLRHLRTRCVLGD